MVCVGHRGRGQAAQVPAHVPRLRAGDRQQDRPAAVPGLRHGAAPRTTSTRSTPTCRAHARQRAHRRGRRGAGTGSRGRLTGVTGAAATRLGAASSARDGARRTSASSLRRPSGSRALCHAMAERFAARRAAARARGSPTARSDARHVAVEFVHPVIVGKRALPAIGAHGGRAARRAARAARTSRTTSPWPSAATRRRADALEALAPPRARLPDPRLEPRAAEWELAPPADDPFVRQELAETLYHVLWELVHVFFDHRGLLEGREAGAVHDTGALGFLYPVPRRSRSTTSRRCSRTCARRC